MTDTKITPPAGADDFTACPHWGQGGSYVFDPATGKRTLVTPAHEDLAPATPDQETPAAVLPASVDAAPSRTDLVAVPNNPSKKEKHA